MRRVLVALVVAVGLLFAGQGAAAAAPAGDSLSGGDTTVTAQPAAHTPPPGTCFANCKQYPPYQIGDDLGESVLTPFTNDEPVRGPGGGSGDDDDRSCTAPCPI